MGIGNIATSGIKAALTNMEAISNNIANVNTLGFKKSYVNFADIYAGNAGGGKQVGIGVTVQSVDQDFSTGRLESTQSGLDLRIANNGFFIQKDASSGQVTYTRAGRLQFDKDGYLMGFNGAIQGYPATNGVVSTTGNLTDMQVPVSAIPAQATDNVSFRLNLDSNSTVLGVAFDPNDPSTYNFRSDETLYDSLGNTYTLSLYYVKTADNTWTAQVGVDGNVIGTGNVTFNSDGSLASATGLTGLSWSPTGGAATPQTFDVVLNSSTQYAADNQVYDHEHTGMASGKLLGVSIDKDGNLISSFSNGLTRIEGQIALAQFQAPQGLLQTDNMSWLESGDSGPAIIGANTSQNAFVSNSLEYSNVDLTEELVKLIGAQHDFQANAQVQQTYNQVMQTIENI